MDESVQAAMAKWPNVPALYGWLGLDETGRWWLRGEMVEHAGLIAFINRNYDCDERGCWFFQNGPQRGYVELAYTPWVAHVDGAGRLFTHTGRAIDSISGAWLDDDGNLLLETAAGVALVDGDSLVRVTDWLRGPAGDDGDQLEQAMTALASGGAAELQLTYAGHAVEVGFVPRTEVPERFGFVATPKADDD